jgi:2-keto-3-deoxy-6-phosphogluconate aldolase
MQARASMPDSGLISIFLAESGDIPAARCTLIVSPNLTRGARPFAVKRRLSMLPGVLAAAR